MNNSFILLCGETNIIKYRQTSKILDDEYRLITFLETHNIKFVFNPVHDYMVRYEMKKKRAFLSLNGRYTISVWNTGKIASSGKKIAEAKEPWTVFFNGEDITSEVDEVIFTTSKNSDLRFGILSV